MAATALRGSWLIARLAVVLAAIAVAVAWKGFGYVPVAVQTGSMTPTYPVHTLLFVHDVPIESIRTGDVISFDPPGPVPRTTHRVVEREKVDGRWYFVTKGDANPAPDDWRTPESGRPTGDTVRDRGITYASDTAPRTELGIPQLGRLATLSSVPHLRLALLLLPFLVVSFQLLAWIWGREDESDNEPEESEHAPDDASRQERAAA